MWIFERIENTNTLDNHITHIITSIDLQYNHIHYSNEYQQYIRIKKQLIYSDY
jgi:hypothetical protein